MLGKTNNTAIANGAFNKPTKVTPWKRLLVSESLLLLKEKRFTKHKFSSSTPISDIKYRHPRSKHKISFHTFNNQLDNALAHYLAESKTIKSNVNKSLNDPLMAPFTEKLSDKNANEWIEKLLEILWGILKNEKIDYKFDVESGVSGIDWLWKQKKKHLFEATIIPILLSSDKTVLSLSHEDQTM